MRILGVLLILLGVIGIGYGGFRFAYPDNVVDAGPLQITVTKHRTVPIPPLLGGVALVGGLVIVLVGRRKAA